MTASNFSALSLSSEFLNNIESLNYNKMTDVQARSLPAILEGKDLLGQAKTGSGKTAAFAIGLLNNLVSAEYQTQALVICPTRELADQVTQEIRRLARAIPNTKIITLCGGKPIGAQLASLEHSPHVVVGTPGRLLKLIESRALSVDALKTLVLDEADRMLDMGFHDDIMKIVRRTPSNRQTLLFSATYPLSIEKVSHAVQSEPVEIRVEALHDNSIIKQIIYPVGSTDRTDKLISALQKHKPESTLVFCTTRRQCQELADQLQGYGFKALAIHGELEQFNRDQVLVQFSNKSISILVATDIAARGLDVKDLAAVINFELSPDPEIYVHRIGRTGRAGKDGLAISLVSDCDAPRLEEIEKYIESELNFDRSGLPRPDRAFSLRPAMKTLFINAGRKHKVRPGDILGALTSDGYLVGSKIGKIDVLEKFSYVAVETGVAKQALKILTAGKVKGKKVRSRLLP